MLDISRSSRETTIQVEEKRFKPCILVFFTTILMCLTIHEMDWPSVNGGSLSIAKEVT